VADLNRKIDEFVKHYNRHPKPFMWTATAESVLAMLGRLCKVINGIRHWSARGRLGAALCSLLGEDLESLSCERGQKRRMTANAF